MMSFLVTLPLFFVVSYGLAWPIAARMPLTSAEKLVASVALSLLGAFGLGWIVYTFALPHGWFWCLPATAVGALILSRDSIRVVAQDPAARAITGTYALLVLWSIGWLACVTCHGGGGWTSDWFEHWERTRFFLEHWPADYRFIGLYPLPARPPLINVITGSFLALTKIDFPHYQLITTLLNSLIFLPAALFAQRWAGNRAVVLLGAAFAVNPLFIQNATFAWTKLSTGFFVLSAIWWFIRGLGAERPRVYTLLSGTLLGAGMVAHYSAGPIAAALTAGALVRGLATRAFFSALKQVALCAGAALLIFLPWVLWSLAHYGGTTTFLSNSSASYAAPGAIEQTMRGVLNIFDTLVPHFLRPFDTSLLNQSNNWGYARDWFFQLYQINLWFACGSVGGIAVVHQLTVAAKSKPDPRWFWLTFVVVAILLGVGVHGARDHWGLTHICLQPLVLLGLVVLATRWEHLPRRWRIAVITGALIDFTAGIVLHFALQSYAFAPPGALEDIAGAFGEGARINASAKAYHRLMFFGDALDIPFLAKAVMLIMIAATGLFFLARRSRHAGRSSPSAPNTLGDDISPPIGGGVKATSASHRLLGSLSGRHPDRYIVIGLVVAALVISLAAARPMFSTFMPYDDEGYVLLTLRNYAEHGALYRDVYTQYGPLPYALYSGLTAIGMPITHTAGRLLTLSFWICTALSLAFLVARATRSLAWGFLTLGLVTFHLWLSVREPTHPGSLVALMLAIIAALGYQCLLKERWSTWAALNGVLIAGLALTKINTGVFAGVAAVGFALLHIESTNLRRITLFLVALGLTTLPFLLMAKQLSTPWVFNLATLFALAAIALVVSSSQTKREFRLGLRELIFGIGFALLTALAVLGVVMPRGTSFSDLLNGVLLGPLRHPIHLAPATPPTIAVLAGGIISLVVCVIARRLTAQQRRIDGLIAILRLLALATTLLAPAALDQSERHLIAFWWVMPWLWIFVWPLATESSRTTLARSWLALLALGEWLQAYPVPGTQAAWGSFLVLPLVALAACDAMACVGERITKHFRFSLPAWGGSTIVFALGGCALVPLLRLGSGYADEQPLQLPGARLLRLPAASVASYRALSLNAAIHADTLFSMPGMFSFNLWSERPPPTLANVTQWFLLLDNAQQRQIIAALERDPRACVIVDPKHLDFLRANGLGPSGELYDYLRHSFVPAFRLGLHEFWVKQGRRIAPFFTAEVLASTAPSDPDQPDTLLLIPLVLPQNERVTQLEIEGFSDMPRPPLLLKSPTARFEITKITTNGDPCEPKHTVTSPFMLSEPSVLAVHFNRRGAVFSLAHTLITVRGEQGSELALVRLRP